MPAAPPTVAPSVISLSSSLLSLLKKLFIDSVYGLNTSVNCTCSSEVNNGFPLSSST